MRRVLAAALVASLLAPAGAYAHGADAQLSLVRSDVSTPQEVSAEVEDALVAMAEAARATGYPVKVAVVDDPNDVGGDERLLRDPQAYADVLTTVLGPAARVLTVHRAGLGGNRLGDAAGDALEGAAPDPDGDADDLARTAMAAIGRLTAAAGRPVPVPEVEDPDGGGPPAAIIAGGVVLTVVLGIGATTLLQRRRQD